MALRLLLIALLIASIFGINPAWPKKYFQQDLEYNISVDLDPQSAKLAGVETIIYHNNSPDTLNEIYFHLYYNAFRPGSYLDIDEQRNGDFEIAGLPENLRGYVDIELLKFDGFETNGFIIDNTIMKALLPNPLPPDSTVEIYIEFASQIPADGSRCGRAGRHYDVGQWYPKPVVYDRYGWHPHQYLDYEFYGEFADFYVELTIPSEYIVAHMGELKNEEEIYGSKLPIPDGDSIITDALGLLKGLRKENSKTEESMDDTLTAGGVDIEMLPAQSQLYSDQGDTVKAGEDTKTWKMEAKNVHDFAFCADPGFIVDICVYDSLTIKAYYTKSNEKFWKHKAADYTRKSIKYFSEKYIPYPYKQYSTVSSLHSGGMEYPQLTMVWQRAGSRGDQYRNFESLIGHEVGHAWFYGILGFNETEQSFLDEGLTTFAIIEYMEEYYGRRQNNFDYKKKWQKRLLPNGDQRNDEQKRYLGRALRRNEDPMDTPANLFKSGRTYYNASYEKAGSVYVMLRYTMGEAKFDAFLREFFQRWAFKHPNFEDFKELAGEVYGGNLEWFFRQWFTTTYHLDYSLDYIKSEKSIRSGAMEYSTSIGVRNNGRCISPLDVVLYYKAGGTDTVRISQEVWQDGRANYDTTLSLRFKPENAFINPAVELADVNYLNNSSGFPRIQWQFMVPNLFYNDNYIEHYVDAYTIAHYPSAWYNSKDGFKLRYRFDGSHLGISKRVELESAVGFASGKVDYLAGYSSPVSAVGPDLDFYARSLEREGRGGQEAGLFWESGDNEIDLSLRRYYVFDPQYIYGMNWSRGDINTFEGRIKREVENRYSNLEIDISAISSVLHSEYDFSRVSSVIKFELPGILGYSTRLNLYGGTSKGNVPSEKKFYLSSGDPIDMWNSPLYRSRGTLPDRWKDDGHLIFAGGGGLYGYHERGIAGKRILSANIERDIPRFRLPFKIPVLATQIRRIKPTIYIASGIVWDENDEFVADGFLSESGFILSYEIPYLNYFISESKISFYFPIWLSDPKPDDSEISFRWYFGFSN